MIFRVNFNYLQDFDKAGKNNEPAGCFLLSAGLTCSLTCRHLSNSASPPSTQMDSFSNVSIKNPGLGPILESDLQHKASTLINVGSCITAATDIRFGFDVNLAGAHLLTL